MGKLWVVTFFTRVTVSPLDCAPVKSANARTEFCGWGVMNRWGFVADGLPFFRGAIGDVNNRDWLAVVDDEPDAGWALHAHTACRTFSW